MIRSIAIFCALLLMASGQSQDLSGFWKGTLTMQAGCFPRNFMEFQLTIDGTNVTGSSYQYMDENNYIRKEMKGSYDALTKSLVLQEGLVHGFNIPPTCFICVKRYELHFVKQGGIEYLTGTWTGVILDSDERCRPGDVAFQRVQESFFKDIPEIKVDTGNIILDFYDNGVVDGDSISVLVNKQVVVSNERLSTRSIQAVVRVDKNKTFHEVEMVAENLGSIPPNTATVIITAGKNKYRLFLTSTESKSARVRIVFDEAAQLHK